MEASKFLKLLCLFKLMMFKEKLWRFSLWKQTGLMVETAKVFLVNESMV